jgi:nitroimidazol reductase NimA-like FMN-containing flavoprotein (pyridoxamine 5'-phosphate oxidase superfamily)
MKFRSVIGFGKAALINNPDDKRRALDIIMRQYSDGAFQYPADLIEKTSIIKIDIESMSGKQSGF